MNNRHVRHYQLQLTRKTDLLLSLRSFRVSPSQRSKKYKQLLIPIEIAGWRQLAVRTKRRKRVQPIDWGSWPQHTMKHPAASYVLLAVGLAGLTFSAVQASLSSQLTPAKTFATTASAYVQKRPAVMPRSEPTHIAIPSVGIDADIKQVGKDANGSIELPGPNEWTAGWYNGSPTPGQIGPSIIVGHVDKPDGISVFWRLREVKPGDTVKINRADGRVATFKITALKQFEQANFPTAEVYGNIEYAGLRLITCGGAFNQATGSYTQNTVVYATLVND